MNYRKTFYNTRLILFLLLIFIWVSVLSFSYFRNISTIKQNIYQLAVQEAKNSFDNDVIYRKWVSQQGGVYVPITKETPPNEYLRVPNRDIETTDGKKLTLVNPAYMTRLVHVIETNTNGLVGRITSLNPLRPSNAPDEWETAVLKKFEDGTKEYHNIELVNDKYVLRYMSSFITEESCLKCHAAQGYKVGDIRGGISVSVPYSDYKGIENKHKAEELWIHFLIGLIGLSGLFAYFKNSTKYRSELENKADELKVERNGLKIKTEQLEKNELTLEDMIARLQQEITERKQAEELLKQNDSLLKELSAQVPGVLYQYRFYPDGRSCFPFASENIWDIYEVTPEEIKTDASIILSRIHDDDRNRVIEKIEHSFKNLNVWELDYRVNLPQSGIKWLRGIAKPIKLDDDSVVWHGYITDITERRIEEQAFYEAQKLNAIGEMASGVAHDFNNSLQVILGNLELANNHAEQNVILQKYFEVIRKTASDSADRIKLLQRSSGNLNTTEERNEVYVKDLIIDVIQQARPLWKNTAEKSGIKITIETEFEDDLKLFVSIGEIRSVAYNLIKNSIEAMPEGGLLKVTSSKIGDDVSIQFSDTGIGMDSNTQAKIFQPFFTTKGFESGRGMGLSGAYSIIKEHNGKIHVINSKINKGTTLEILLPISKNNINSVAKKDENNKSISLQILYVDDDSQIRDIAAEMLNVLGHTGTIVDSGPAAIELINKNEYDLLVTDIGMPGMTGWQLIDILNSRNICKMKIVVSSGWGSEVDDTKIKIYGVSAVLAKPFRIKQFSELIHKLFNLDETQ